MNRLILVIALSLVTRADTYSQNWQSLGKGTDWFIYGLYPDSIADKLYVGGSFSWVDGNIYAPGVAAWNGIGWEKLDGSCDNGGAVAFYNYHDTLFVGGGFSVVGGIPSKYLAKWKNDQWIPYGITNAYISCFVVWNDELYASGAFDTMAGIRANGIAKWNGYTWSTVGDLFGFGNLAPNLIGKIAVIDNKLYAGGIIYDSLGNVCDFASWDGSTWTYYYDIFKGPFSGGFPWVEYKNEIYVIGLFSKADGNPANCVATFDGTSLHDVGGGITNTVPYAQLTDAFVYHDKLYVVGIFDNAGGVPAQNIACWDGAKWCGLGSEIDNKIGSITSYHDTLYVQGGFTTIDGDTMNHIAKWLGGDYTDTCSTPVGISEVSSTSLILFTYPNPASTELSFVTSEPGDILITDNLGQMIKRISIDNWTHNISVNELPSGVYFISLFTRNSSLTQKVIIQH